MSSGSPFGQAQSDINNHLLNEVSDIKTDIGDIKADVRVIKEYIADDEKKGDKQHRWNIAVIGGMVGAATSAFFVWLMGLF